MADVLNSTLLELNEGTRELTGALVVLVKTEWNQTIVDELERGCRAVLEKNGIRVVSVQVPGAVEIPFAIHHYWKNARKKERPDAFIALGCVIRGGTPHFEYVCQAVTTGLTQLNISLPVPGIFGVLTVDNQQQAEERIGGVHGHKGEEAAITALKMIVLSRALKR